MMERRIRETVAFIPRNLVYAGGLIVAMPVIGTAGYMIIEGWGFMDALYMSVITLTTVGYREVQPLDRAGQVFTMIYSIAGVGVLFYGLFALFQFLLEGELGSFLGVRRMKGQISSLNDHYILCGFGRVGEEISREFADRKIPFVVVEINPEAIERAERRGVLLLVGDATTDEALREAGIMRAQCLLAASDSDSGNTFIVLTAKALNPALFIVARAGIPESEPRMLRAGADRVFSPYITAGRQMALSALQPNIVEFIDTLSMRHEGGPVLAEIEISEGSGLAGQTINDILRWTSSIVVLGVQKDSGQLQVGPANTIVLEAGDRVIVMGEEEELERIRPARGEAVR
jgi:voltage-gated potassium channel